MLTSALLARRPQADALGMFSEGPPAAAGARRTTTAQAAPNSDAMLSCPACMVTVCFDCQRHEVYPDQFRAMFVVNCSVDRSETLNFREKGPKRYRNKKQREADAAAAGLEVFHPVKCNECNTAIGVYDADEIYHVSLTAFDRSSLVPRGAAPRHDQRGERVLSSPLPRDTRAESPPPLRHCAGYSSATCYPLRWAVLKATATPARAAG